MFVMSWKERHATSAHDTAGFDLDVDVGFWLQNSDHFVAQNSVEWLVSFKLSILSFFCSYCLLTPLVSPKDRKCKFIDWLIDFCQHVHGASHGSSSVADDSSIAHQKSIWSCGKACRWVIDWSPEERLKLPQGTQRWQQQAGPAAAHVGNLAEELLPSGPKLAAEWPSLQTASFLHNMIVKLPHVWQVMRCRH